MSPEEEKRQHDGRRKKKVGWGVVSGKWRKCCWVQGVLGHSLSLSWFPNKILRTQVQGGTGAGEAIVTIKGQLHPRGLGSIQNLDCSGTGDNNMKKLTHTHTQMVARKLGKSE